MATAHVPAKDVSQFGDSSFLCIRNAPPQALYFLLPAHVNGVFARARECACFSLSVGPSPTFLLSVDGDDDGKTTMSFIFISARCHGCVLNKKGRQDMEDVPRDS